MNAHGAEIQSGADSPVVIQRPRRITLENLPIIGSIVKAARERARLSGEYPAVVLPSTFDATPGRHGAVFGMTQEERSGEGSPRGPVLREISDTFGL